jgi:hypothetical protein
VLIVGGLGSAQSALGQRGTTFAGNRIVMEVVQKWPRPIY